MNNSKLARLLSIFSVSVLFAATQSAIGQGSLTPPGAPAPSMKTLAEMEPRTAITNSGALNIVNSGSYYLTTNITVSTGTAIFISANNVTLDLNGFTIRSTAASATGGAITVLGTRTNISLFNGHISSGVTNNAGVFSGSGFAYGISGSSSLYNIRVRDISVCGILYYGIYLVGGGGSSAINCTVQEAGSYGIGADTVTDCSAVDCGTTAIYAIVANNCSGISVSGTGLYATTAINCYGATSAASAIGLYAQTAQNCYGYATGNSSIGLYASVAQNCYGYSAAGGDGIYAYNCQLCYGYNAGAGYGIYAQDTAIGCRGFSSSGVGLYAYIANSSHGVTTSGTAKNVSFPYNMP